MSPPQSSLFSGYSNFTISGGAFNLIAGDLNQCDCIRVHPDGIQDVAGTVNRYNIYMYNPIVIFAHHGTAPPQIIQNDLSAHDDMDCTPEFWGRESNDGSWVPQSSAWTPSEQPSYGSQGHLLPEFAFRGADYSRQPCSEQRPAKLKSEWASRRSESQGTGPARYVRPQVRNGTNAYLAARKHILRAQTLRRSTLSRQCSCPETVECVRRT
ncbi:hypothetical protein C8R44DRAFT_981228 [Mycena epipterygia]|nr:hypothetical protein C8R44DRAFT_981228 [Mycena epipterygia]